jgi:hypothetical protein
MRISVGATSRLRRSQLAHLRLGATTIHLRSKDEELEHRRLLEGGLGPMQSIAEQCIVSHKDLSIHVRLSCAWSRLLTLPAIEQLTREEHWRNYARARFEQIYGDDADQWDIQVARDLPGHNRLAVAWPTALRERLLALANVRSVRVDLLEQLGLLLAQIPTFSGCLLEIEPGGAGMVLLASGKVRRTRWCRSENAQGLAAAVCSEWAGVQANDTVPPGETALALASAAPRADTDQARAVRLLASRMGIARAFSLTDGTPCASSHLAAVR